ncbi:anaerobic glycerol-3-phosphate dehydrogenase subunit GlpA [Anaerolineales bacterium HSG25]|nr:anaerobic glycerol-3-phosphate dehydrogenase subunit GlpA [Anaerolineales bacterium HSG25]
MSTLPKYNTMKKSTEVLVIGGGVTGCGVLFDLAQRGFKAVLLERGGLSMGTSGRFHGLLHSGGRYVVNDADAAKECIDENQILRRVMPQAIEDTGGLFVVTPGDPLEFADQFYQACQQVGIPVEELSISEMLHREPLLNPQISRAFAVPDASVETWEACRALVDSAKAFGAEVFEFYEVIEVLTANGAVTGVVAQNRISGETMTIEADLVVNATGAWGGHIAQMAGCDVTVHAGKGTMVAMNYRMVNTVINRCIYPHDGDILVPVGSVAVIGTTSVDVPNPDNYLIEDWEIKLMMDEGEKLVPTIKQFRALRAWAGIRPLYQDKTAGDDLRDVTRKYALLDHTTRDGVDNFVTITGGKWTTYRLMAEHTVDLVCQKLATTRECRTATTVLKTKDEHKFYQLGQRLDKLETGELDGQLICECELVTRPQIEARLAQTDHHIVTDLRRELRVGMGPCQGGFCAYRVVGIMLEQKDITAAQANKALVDFLQERWKGIKPVLWGQQLRQMKLDEGIYLGLLGLDKLPPELTGIELPRIGEVETEGYYEVKDGD